MRARSRRATERYALTFVLALALGLEWSAIGCRKGRPPRDLAVVSQGSAAESLVAGPPGESVLPIGPKTPHVEWRYTYRYGFVGLPRAMPDGTLYAGTQDGQLLAFGHDGTVKWQADVGNQVVGAPAVASDGSIYVGTTDGYLVALDPDGNMRWRYFTVGRVSGPPVIAADGVVYFGSDDGCLYAMNPDGTEKWSHRFGDPGKYGFEVGQVEVASDGTLRVFGGALYALDRAGAVLWYRDDVSRGPMVALPDGDTIIAETRVHETDDGCFSTMLTRVGGDGSIVWQHRLAQEFAQLAVFSTDCVWVLDPGGGASAFHLNGDTVVAPPAPRRYHDTLVVYTTADGEGTRYAVCKDGALRSFDPGGSPQWAIQVTGKPANYHDGATMVLGPDGRVYVTRWDGVAYVVGDKACGDPADEGFPPESPVLREGDHSYSRGGIGEAVRAVEAGGRTTRGPEVERLGSRGEWAAPAVPALIKMLGMDKPETRCYAVTALASLGPVAADARPHLIELLGVETHPQALHALLQAVGEMRPLASEAVPALVRLLESQSSGGDQTRQEAIDCLGKLGGAAAPAVPKLVEIGFAEEPRNIADGARKALVAIGRPSVAPLAKLLDASDRETSRGVCTTLGKIGEPALDVLVRALNNADPETRQYAIAALRCITCDGAIAALEKRERAEDDPLTLARIRGALEATRPKPGAGTTAR